MQLQHPQVTVQGAGLGLRRDLMQLLEADDFPPLDFMEAAPENWIEVGGSLGKRFRAFTERYAFVAHGLSLSLGGPEPLDTALLLSIKNF